MAIFMGNGGSLGAVYAGRFVAGLGVGQTVVVAPVYLAEIVSYIRSFFFQRFSSNIVRLRLLFEVSALAFSLVLSISVCISKITSSQGSLTSPGLGALLVSAINITNSDDLCRYCSGIFRKLWM